MKSTKNVKRHFAMSLIDGRTIILTREILTNPDYRVISESLAKELDSGNKDWRKVAFELRQRDSMNLEELVKRAEQEKVKNMRKSPVTRENVEQFETKLTEEEIGEVFDGNGVPEEKVGEEKQKSEESDEKKKTSGKKSSKNKATEKQKSEEADEGQGEPDGDPAGAESLDI